MLKRLDTSTLEALETLEKVERLTLEQLETLKTFETQTSEKPKTIEMLKTFETPEQLKNFGTPKTLESVVHQTLDSASISAALSELLPQLTKLANEFFDVGSSVIRFTGEVSNNGSFEVAVE